ncbi:MAG: PA14 domain-containing protein [Planctomycetota bacterium]
MNRVLIIIGSLALFATLAVVAWPRPAASPPSDPARMSPMPPIPKQAPDTGEVLPRNAHEEHVHTATGSATPPVVPENLPEAVSSSTDFAAACGRPASVTLPATASELRQSIQPIAAHGDAELLFRSTLGGVEQARHLHARWRVTDGRTTTNLSYRATPATMAGGLQAAFYDYTATLHKLPNLAGRMPDLTRIDATVDYPATNQAWTGLPVTMRDTFASQYTGFLKVTEAGTYTLEITSDDGSRVTLDDRVLIANDGKHGMRRRSATIDLATGLHPTTIDYFENAGRAGLIFSWIRPGQTAREVVPAGNLIHAAGLVPGPVDRRPFTASIHQEVKSSPTIIDGTAWGEAYSVTAQASTLGAEPVSVARIGTTTQWFQDLPLDPNQPTTVTFAQSGSPTPSTITGTIDWIPVSMYHDEAITIRVGDSIKLQAIAGCGGAHVRIDADGDGTIDHEGSDSEAVVHRYDTAGVYHARAYDVGDNEIGTATVTVTEVRLPKAIACQVGFMRQVTIHTGVHDPAELVITTNDPTPAKPSLMLVERGPAIENHLRIYLKCLRRGTPILYVRQGSEDGPILAAMEIDEFTLDGSDLNNVVVNGETSMAAGFITMRPYVPNLDVVANMFASTSAFESGDGKTLTTNTDAFNIRTDPATGETIADMRFNFMIPDSENQFCFNVKFWQENQEPVPVGDESKNGKRCKIVVPVIAFPYRAAAQGAQSQTKVLNVACHHKGDAHIDHPLVVVPDANGAGPAAANGATVNCPDPKGDKDPPAILPVNITSAPGTPPAYYDVTVEGTIFPQKVIVVQVTPAMGDPHRVGISVGANNRTQARTAAVLPAGEAANVTPSAQDGKVTVAPKAAAGGNVSFDIVGKTKSAAQGDTGVTFTHSLAGLCASAPVSVIVPAAIATPHPTFGPATVAPQNALLNSSTRPAQPAVTPPDVHRAIVVTTDLLVTVHDQFGLDCGDIYSGASITEAGDDINVTLDANSQYSDRVGIMFIDSNGPYAPADPAVANWLASPVPPVQSQTLSIQKNVEVDGFGIGNTGSRLAIFTAPDTLEIQWP